ncbi:TetR/AcrR family transcriptional regulator [Mycobacterium sp.]|uniref:TetR/AcrR family transcriptional regulator n=1 Tax=Mycobacterium sp. TaxID=1785 RepID=UPI003C78213A
MKPTRTPRRQRRRVRPTREQTKKVLLGAAREVFAQRGYEQTTLDDVAEAAGLTKGAVYSSFQSKAELFYALMDEQVRERLDLTTKEVESFDGVGNLDQLSANIGTVFRDLLVAQREWQLMYVDFWSVAARDPRLQQSFAEHRREVRTLIGSIFQRIAKEMDTELPMSGEHLAAIVLGLVNGVAMEQIADPEQLQPELLVQGLQMLIKGVSATNADRD